ncbi:uncharacterized protein PG986_010578 [Apiospora aurea]|uniref:Transcription factor Iwr1 domain-containing protein n=1 Tax=Apiospora aurea TaxID=335848 RepID=A0ABR1Q2R2_9PEZI
MARTMAAQDLHPNVLEEILGPQLLNLQREATALLDQSLELADLIWELEGEYFSSQELCGRGASLQSVTGYDHDAAEEFTPLPDYDLEENDDDSNVEVYYQLADLRAEAAELSKRSGDAWTLFCEEIVARLSPSSPAYETVPWRPQKQKQKIRQQGRHHQLSHGTLALRDEYIEGEEDEEEAGLMMPPMVNATEEEASPHYYYADDEDAFMPSTHTEEIPIYFEEDADLAELYWRFHDDYNVSRDYYGEEVVADEVDDYEFMEMIRQEYLDLAEQYLASSHVLHQTNTPSDTGDSGADGDGKEKPAAIANVEELPGLFENPMEGKEDGDYDDSGYDEEEEIEVEVHVNSSPSQRHNDSGFVEGEDTDSENESFKTCLDEFDGGDGDGDDGEL